MQQFLESAVIALSAIWSNKLRSFLTVIGNVVAVTSIIAVVSLVQGLNKSVKDAIQAQVGADQFTVQQFGAVFSQDDFLRVQGNPRITFEDAAAIRTYAPAVALVMAQSNTGAQAKYKSQTLDSLGVQGVTKEFGLLPTTNIEIGRLITANEFNDGRYVAVLGWDAADRLFGTIDPIDKQITIAGVHFTVVGVAAKKGAIFGQSQDEYAVIPLEALRHVFGTRRPLSLVVRPKDPSLVTTAMDETTMALRIQRRLRPKQPDNFGVVSSDTFLNIYNSVMSGIVSVLLGVVGLSLVVGGIVIMNIMLMVVTERTREIGLRKALGARRRDIMWQILTESVTLSTFGGLIGTGLGFIVAFTISRFTPFSAIVEVWSVALGISMTAIVGLFFGMYPAMRAAKLDPIDALRRE